MITSLLNQAYDDQEKLYKNTTTSLLNQAYDDQEKLYKNKIKMTTSLLNQAYDDQEKLYTQEKDEENLEKNNLIPNKDKKPYEMKTIQKDKTSIFLSSVCGWELKEGKILVVIEIEKVLGSRPKRDGIQNKGKDIMGKFYKLTIYKFEKEHIKLFPYYEDKINLSHLTSSNLKNNKDLHEKYKKKVTDINLLNKKLPIRLSLMLNSGGTGRLYYTTTTKKIQDLICDDVKCFKSFEKYKNYTIKLYKDYTNINGPKGFYNQSMIDWEYNNEIIIEKSTQPNLERNQKKKKKYLGDVYINDKLWRKNYKNTRQDFWLGYVFEELAVEDNLYLEKTKFNTPGQDFIYTG